MYSFLGVRAAKLINGVGALREGLIGSKALRAFLACLEAGAENETKIRSIRQKTAKVVPLAPITPTQVKRLLGASCSRELRQLQRAGLITKREGEITITETLLSFGDFDERRSAARLIPVPREMLRALIHETRPGLVLTALVYFLRGLSFERGTGKVKRAGAVKATTIAEITGLSERAVRAARAELIQRGWITRDEASTQWKLNRTGAYFEINCEWRSRPPVRSRPPRQTLLSGAAKCSFQGSGTAETAAFSGVGEQEPEERRGHHEPRSAQAVDNLLAAPAESAPLVGQNCTQFAPPIKRPERFFQNHKNQKAPTAATAPAATGTEKESGFCMKKRGEEKETKPDIRNIKIIDLKNPKRLEMLYAELIRIGELQPGEATAINFAAAAVRAGRLDLPDERRVKVFLGIIKRRLWANITQAEEDQALSVIRRCREQEPGFMRAA